MKNTIVLIAITLLLFSCSKDDTPPQEAQNETPKIESQTFNVSESLDETTVIGTIVATDVNNDALTFTIATNDNGLFTVNDTGELTLASGKTLDYDIAQTHTIKVAVSDGTNTVSATITINVTEVIENSSLSDDFKGNGPLLNYITNNESALPDVTRTDGRYRANLVNNQDNITLHFNNDQGRLDAKKVKFPFEYIARNIGIGTQEDSQTAPSSNGNSYLFCGVQVHTLSLNQANSSHVVVGHRGNASFTIEGKNTLDGNSSVNDIGANTIPQGRADIRIVGNQDNTLTVYWQLPNTTQNPQNDSWTLYNAIGELPGTAPSYSSEVYIGLITYAFHSTGVPFVGTCDAIQGKEL
ncbi:cadherin repeat domain-containing protein [Aquimarina algiphila]|uniref:cadherin repeat domain-containing protein n=1 Tax=Aquimarina algiphila TaxID=2047982 RepID=UPI00232BEEC9|nr:cadherin repeat domain-containing protein [Aquimarina algiphila]